MKAFSDLRQQLRQRQGIAAQLKKTVLGTDTFVVADSYSGVDAPRVLAQRSAIQRQGVRRLLSLLPPDVARRIAIDNAERIYRLR